MSHPACPECGCPLPEGAPDASCPACLLLLGMAAAADRTTVVGPSGAPPPTEAGHSTEGAGDRIDRYKLLEVIGEGGFGTVWMAEQEEPVRRRVALKIIKLGMDTREVVARFEAERQALAMMDHPNIARVFDGGATNRGRPYFVMELVRGVPVTAYCDQARFSLRERLELFVAVCQAVQHAHQKGVIHRDLKPSNVLVTEQDGRAVPKVIDFGIAKATEARLTEKTLFTRFNQFIGTPAYMSPEQAGLGGLDIDTRSDVYSLGVLLYELLTGKTPFDQRKLQEAGYEALLKSIREIEPPRPSTRLSALTREELTALAERRREDPLKLNKAIRGELDWIILKALEKDRARRYETANGLAGDLQRFLHNEPVLAAPPGLGYQIAKFARRNRIVLGTASAFAVVMLAGTTVSLWQAVRANHHADAERWQATIAGAARHQAEESFEVTRESLYAADVSLAQRALEEGNLGLAHRALVAHLPGPESRNPKTPSRLLPDLRGFEWRYLWAQCQGDQLAILRGHSNAVSCLAFAADGQTLLSGGADRTVRLWDIPTRNLIRTYSTRTNDVAGVALSRSGRRFFSVTTEGMVESWNVQTGKVEFTYSPLVGIVSLSPSLTRFATAAYEEAGQRIQITALGNALPECTLTNGQGRVAFAHDNRRVALPGQTGFAIWGIPRTQLLHRVETPMKLDALAFSPGDRRLAGWSSFSRAVFLWNGTNGASVGELNGHTGKILDAAFSPDEARLATASADQSVRLWDLDTRREIACWRGHQSEVRAVAFSPDGQMLASAGKDGTIRFWPGEPVPAPVEITDAYPPFALSADGHTVAAPNQPIPQEGTVSGRWNEPFVLAEDGRWQGADPVARGRRPLTRLLNLTAEEEAQRLDLHPMLPAFFDSTRTNLIAVGRHWPGGNLRLASVTAAGQTSSHPVELQDSRDTHLATLASVDGRTAVIVAVTGRILAYDVQNGTRLGELGETDRRRPVLKLSPDGRYLAAYSPRAGAIVWDVNTRALRCRLAGVDRAVLDFAFSHDGRILAVAGVDNEIVLLDLPEGRVRARLPGHSEPVLQVTFAPDDLTLGSSSADGTVKLWSVAARREVATLAHDHPLTWLAFTGDGRALIGGSARGRLRIWRAPPLGQIDTEYSLTREAAG